MKVERSRGPAIVRKKRERRAEPGSRSTSAVKYAALPSAIQDKRFIGVPDTIVYAWRSRGGSASGWHRCKVVRVADTLVELWDEALGQWMCFDPSGATAPDVRISASQG